MSAPREPRVGVEQQGDWLVARFWQPHRVASWAIVGGGITRTTTVAWHRVRDDDLTLDVDPRALLRARLCAMGFADAVGMLTSANLTRFEQETVRDGDVGAHAVVTVGLSNARRVGDPASPFATGTINLLVAVSTPLRDEALLEAMSIAAEARTVAVLERGMPSPVSGLPASGTGTDCVVVAAPEGDGHAYAGKHTRVGSALGAAVYAATKRGVEAWRCSR
jgi:adenosylcobinamide amidohydrolase